MVPGLVTMINASGTRDAPLINFTLANLTIRDAANGWFEPHNMPSGGDWAIARVGAVLMQVRSYLNY